jgi:hypothetical protein
MQAEINLTETISSTQDLKSLILEARQYSNWFSHNIIKDSPTSANQTDLFSLSTELKQLLEKWSIKNPINQKSLDELIKTLGIIANNSPQISITLAAVTGSSLQKSIVVWCRKNINSNILVDFSFNSSLLGGMVVKYGSHIYDWSFRRQILANLEAFPEILRNV